MTEEKDWLSQFRKNLKNTEQLWQRIFEEKEKREKALRECLKKYEEQKKK